MKSLRSKGSVHRLRAVRRSNNEPWKYLDSVTTETAAAPPGS